MSAKILHLNPRPHVRPTVRRARRGPPSSLEPIKIKSAAAWRYQWLEAVAERPDTSRAELAVAIVLMSAYRVDRSAAQIGLARIAKRAGCSRSSAATATKRLRAKGLLAVTNAGMRTADKALETYCYRLIYEARGVV